MNRAHQFSLRRITWLVLMLTMGVAGAQLVNSEWNVGNGNWNLATNWFPNDVPDDGGGITYNVQIGNRLVAAGAGVTFVPEDGTSDTISALTITNSGNPGVSGADLFTNGNQLIVLGQTTLNGSGSTIRVDNHNTPGTVAFNTDNLDLNTGGGLTMEGGIATVDVLFEINTGTLGGHGTVNVGDNDLVVEKVFENSSLVQPSSNNTAPQTLTIHSNGVDTIDLDGDSETGLVDVDNFLVNVNADTVTLVIDGPLSDAFSGTLQIGQRDTVTFNDSFTMAGANVDFVGGANGATLNGPAAITSITTSAFTVAGDAVIANNMTFTGAVNTVTVGANASLTLNGTVTIPQASALSLAGGSELIIGGTTTITDATGDFDWDGGPANTTVQGTGVLTLTVDQIDLGNDIYNSTLNLNDNGDLSVSVTGTEWQMAGTLNKNGAGSSNITGDRMVVTGTGNIVVNAGTLDTPAITLQAGSDVTVNGTLILGGGADLAGPTTLTGTGTLRMEASSTVSANTTVNVSTFDWDGNAVGGTHTINAGVTLTINSPNFDADGDMDDIFSLAGAGSQLVVSGPTQWTANGTITANAAAAGTATIGGTSRMMLAATMNVDGNTTISAPLTFTSDAFVSIDSGMTLNANGNTVYDGCTINGQGSYDPGPANTVTADSIINSTIFNFDGGNWTVQDSALLVVGVGDYDPDAAPSAFGTTISLNNGGVSVNTGDSEFVMDGILNLNATGGNGAEWSGEPIDIGNDGGVLDADLNVTGDGNPNSQGRFFAPVDFNSDADVNVAAGASLVFNSTVNFDTVNGVNNAEFTGAGTISFNNVVNVDEAVTLNMVGGTVDLDGNDATGEFINIDAPLVINAATLSSFGRMNGGGGVNTLDINNSVGTGSLTVTLGSPSAEWTLNAPGVMNLVNDNVNATLLIGNGINLNGTVNVIGQVQTSARVDIGGTINLNTPGQAFHLNAGNSSTDTNTITGGVISGTGILNATTDRSLYGFGTINTQIDFDGFGAQLKADNGTLNLTGASILDVGVLGTADIDGVLNVAGAWNSSVADAVSLNGGELRGGAITVANTAGIDGHGLVSARVVNNTKLVALSAGNRLTFETAANDNDWDGAANTGTLQASAAGATLELRDNATFPFLGTVRATGATVFTNGFQLNFQLGSNLILTGGTYKSSVTTNLNGGVTVNAGADSTIDVAVNSFLVFEPTSVTALNSNLRMVNNNINIEAGATFSGTGALIVPDNSHLVAKPNSNINVLLDNEGAFRPGGISAVGRVDLRDYQQTDSGELIVELTGTALNQFDRLVVNGAAQLSGLLNIAVQGGFVPAAAQTFEIITATGGVTGKFAGFAQTGMPAGLVFDVTYLPNSVRLTVKAGTHYDVWIQKFASLTNPADRLKTADPDHDGLTNLAEFALDADPTKPGGATKLFPKVATVGGQPVFTITFPVRYLSVKFPPAQPVGKLIIMEVDDQMDYHIEAADLFNSWGLEVTEVTGADATAIQAGLPPVDPEWTYRTFRSPGPVTGDPAEFMRVRITE